MDYKTKYERLIELCRIISGDDVTETPQSSILFHQSIARLGKEVAAYDREKEAEKVKAK